MKYRVVVIFEADSQEEAESVGDYVDELVSDSHECNLLSVAVLEDPDE